MLQESHLAAVSFSDTRLCSQVLYLFAKLSLKEAQYGQAVKLCHQAQLIYNGDEMFFYETTILMADACMNDYTLRNRHRRVSTTFLSDFLKMMKRVPLILKKTGTK